MDSEYYVVCRAITKDKILELDIVFSLAIGVYFQLVDARKNRP